MIGFLSMSAKLTSFLQASDMINLGVIKATTTFEEEKRSKHEFHQETFNFTKNQDYLTMKYSLVDFIVQMVSTPHLANVHPA